VSTWVKGAIHRAVHQYKVNAGQSKEENLRSLHASDDLLPQLFESDQKEPSSINECYVNLQVVQKEKKSVFLPSLFSSLQGEKKRVLIVGDAGVGKTTLLHHISYKWGKKELFDEFSYLFRVRLRNLSSGAWKKEYAEKDIKESLLPCFLHYCLKNTSSHQEDFHIGEEKKRRMLTLDEVKRIDFKSREKTVLLLDGYDEVSYLALDPTSDLVKLRSAIFSKYPNIIMSARPNAVDALLQKEFALQVENVGLDDIGMKKYIGKYFGEKNISLTQTLWSFLEKNPEVKKICETPINVELVCQLWSQEETRSKLGGNVTLGSLYSHIVLWMGREYLAKFYKKDKAGILDEQVLSHPSISFLKELGYAATYSGSTTLSPELVQKSLRKYSSSIELGVKSLFQEGVVPSEIHAVFKLGLLKSEGSGRFIEKENLSFVHATFQEWMGAQYLKEALFSKEEKRVSSAIQFITAPPNEERYPMAMKFLASLLSLEKSAEGIEVHKLFWNAVYLGSESAIKIMGTKEISFLMELLSQTMQSGKVDSRVPAEILSYIDQVVCKDALFWKEGLKKSRYSSKPIVEALVSMLDNLGDKSRLLDAMDLICHMQISPCLQGCIAKPLLNRLSDADGDIAESAIYALYPFANLKEVKQRLLHLASAQSGRASFAAIEVLGKIADPESTEKLTTLLNSQNPFTVASAMDALAIKGDIHMYTLYYLITKLADKGPNREFIAGRALRAINTLDYSRANVVDTLITFLIEPKDPSHFSLGVHGLSNIARDYPAAADAIVQKFLDSYNGKIKLTIEEQCELASACFRMSDAGGRPGVLVAFDLLYMRRQAKCTPDEKACILQTMKNLVMEAPDHLLLDILKVVIVARTSSSLTNHIKPIQELIRVLADRIPERLVLDALTLLLKEHTVPKSTTKDSVAQLKALTGIKALLCKIPEGKNFPWKEKLHNHFDCDMLKNLRVLDDFDFDWPTEEDAVRVVVAKTENVPVLSEKELAVCKKELGSINAMTRECALEKLKSSDCLDAFLVQALEDLSGKKEVFFSLLEQIKQVFQDRASLLSSIDSRWSTYSGMSKCEMKIDGDKVMQFLEGKEEDLSSLAAEIVENKVDIKISRLFTKVCHPEYRVTIQERTYCIKHVTPSQYERIYSLFKEVSCYSNLTRKPLTPLHKEEITDFICQDHPLSIHNFHVAIVRSMGLIVAQKKTFFGDVVIEKFDLQNRRLTSYIKLPSQIDAGFRSEFFGPHFSEEKEYCSIDFMELEKEPKEMIFEALQEGIALGDLEPVIQASLSGSYQTRKVRSQDLLTEKSIITKEEFSSLKENIAGLQSDILELDAKQKMVEKMVSLLHESLRSIDAMPKGFSPPVGSYEESLYNTIRWQLNAVYTAAVAVQTDIVANSKTGTLGDMGNVLSMVGNAIPLVGAGVQMFSLLLTYIDHAEQSRAVARYAGLAASPVDMARFADMLAKELVESSLDIEKIMHPDGILEESAHFLGASLSRAKESEFGKAIGKMFSSPIVEETSQESKKGVEHGLRIASLLISRIYGEKKLRNFDMQHNASLLMQFIKQKYTLNKKQIFASLETPSIEVGKRSLYRGSSSTSSGSDLSASHEVCLVRSSSEEEKVIVGGIACDIGAIKNAVEKPHSRFGKLGWPFSSQGASNLKV
jgi:hypothetical protein